MSSSVLAQALVAAPAARRWRPGPIVLRSAPFALLLAEVLVVSLCYENPRGPGVFGWIFGRLGLAFRCLAVMAGTAGIFGGRRIVRTLAAGSRAWPIRSALAYLFFQVAAFLGFFALSAEVLAGAANSWPATAAWVLLGLACPVLAASAAAPLRLWAAAVSPGLLAVGAAVGVLATTAGRSAQEAWGLLSDATLLTSRFWMQLIHPAVVYQPAEFKLGTPRFAGTIAYGCSGVEGMGLMTVMLGAYLAYSRRQIRPVAWALLPLGVLTVWFCNTLRIAALLTIGDAGYPEVATGGFHSQAGWLAFVAVALGMVAVSKTRPFRRPAEEATIGADPAASNPTVPYVLPLMALVASTMLAQLVSPGDGFDRYYALRVPAVALAAWACRRHYPGGLRSLAGFSWEAVGIGAIVFVLWMALEPAGPASDGPPPAFGSLPADWAAAWLAFRVVGSVVAVPLAEELAFRGFLLRRLIAADFERVSPGRLTWLSLIVSSALFGALHGRWLAGSLAGALYALAMARRGRLGDAILAHAVTNAMLAVVVLGEGRWSLWS